jgi:hypothetical protein
LAEREGYRLSVETHQRQGRKPGPEAQWKKFCAAAVRTPDIEIWGAWARGELAAIVVLALVEDCLNIHLQSSRTEALALSPNNALTFAVTQAKLKDPRIASICYGQTSLNPGLDAYKTAMGYRVLETGDRIVFTPLLKPFFLLGGRSIVNWISNRRPDDLKWRRASLLLKHDARRQPRDAVTCPVSDIGRSGGPTNL